MGVIVVVAVVVVVVVIALAVAEVIGAAGRGCEVTWLIAWKRTVAG